MEKEEKVKDVEVIEEKIIEVKKDKKKKKKKDKKPMNFFLLFFLMLLAFFAEEAIMMVFPSLFSTVIKYGKYGVDVIHEISAVLVILVIIFISGHGYIFTEKRTSFKESIKVGWPFFALALFLLLINGISLKSFDFPNFFSMFLLVFFVGIYEELLCRGWLLNSFVRTHNKKYSQVILSVILSALIFGSMHIVNALVGQSLFETCMQILQATAMGFFLGGVYYRTKNIYSVMFLHGFFDFAVMIGEMNMLRDCTNGAVTHGIFVYQTLSSLFISLMYICWGICVLRRDKVDPLLDEPKGVKERKLLPKIFATLSVIFLFAIDFVPRPEGYDEYQICYEYDTIEIGISDLHYSQKAEFVLEDNGFAFEIKKDDDDLVMINKNTKDKVVLIEKVVDYELIKETNGYMIIAIDRDANYNDRVNYSTVITPSMYSDDKEFLNNIKDSFNLYVIPSYDRLGYITNEYTDYVYPLIEVKQEHSFVIDAEGKIKLVKYTKEEMKKEEKPVTEIPDESIKEAVDPVLASEEIVGAGVTNEQIEEVINQTDNGAQIGELVEQQ